MLRLAAILNPIGHVRAQVLAKRRSRAQRPSLESLEHLVLLTDVSGQWQGTGTPPGSSSPVYSDTMNLTQSQNDVQGTEVVEEIADPQYFADYTLSGTFDPATNALDLTQTAITDENNPPGGSFALGTLKATVSSDGNSFAGLWNNTNSFSFTRIPTPKQSPTITWPTPANIVYGTMLGAAQLDAMASVPGTFTYSPPAGTVLHAGKDQSLSLTFTPTDTTDYNDVTAKVSINVSQATPTITWANPANIVYANMLGPAQLDATASVPGIFTYSPPDGKILAVGINQTLSVSFTPTDTTDYTNATASVTINVLPVIVPPPPVGQVHKTKIALTPTSRFAIPGRPIILTVTVENLSHKGGAPTGQLRFLDGTTILRTVTLRHGQARLPISGLAFPFTIQADYLGNLSFGHSSIHVTVRAPRSRH